MTVDTPYSTEIAIQYEAVIGLEVHCQLLTQSKIFAADANLFGAEPNTNISVITLAHPGTLPKLNRRAVEFAVRMGLACGSDITRHNVFARKNYFYPDLPKGYQLSQDKGPICVGGGIFIIAKDESGKEYQTIIQLHHIHLEEDAGKSIHDADPNATCLDYNRAGTPLIEMVTDPTIRSADEAGQFLTEVRRLVRYLDICEGNMEEGSLRCDVNVSIRADMPALPAEVLQKFKTKYGLPDYDAALLTDTRELAEYYEAVCQHTGNYKAASNWVMGPVKGQLNEKTLRDRQFPVSATQLANLIVLIDAGTISQTAAQQVFLLMQQQPDADPADLAQQSGLVQNRNTDALQTLVEEVLAAWPDKADQFRKGKKNLLGMFVGEVMKKSKGSADPKLVNELMLKTLQK